MSNFAPSPSQCEEQMIQLEQVRGWYFANQPTGDFVRGAAVQAPRVVNSAFCQPSSCNTEAIPAAIRQRLKH